MKLLYLSCHAILEYDELKLFEELGIDYFSLGSYIVPHKPVDPIRPALTKIPDPELLSIAPDRDNMPQEFIDKFDVIVVMHKKEWIINNWEKLKHKTVIWRTIGQSTPAYERELFQMRQEGLKIVRYSKREANITDNIGCDKVIPFYKDPEEFNSWNGLGNELIVFHQDLKNRGEFVGYQHVVNVMAGFPAHVYGPNNQNLEGLNGGFLSYQEMRQKMRDATVYLYTGTQPACYTLNLIEAMMTGIPIVAIGPKLWNSLDLAGDVYEIPDIIHNAVNGFINDDIDKLREVVRYLLDNRSVAKRIGEMGRQTAIEWFGKDKVKQKWDEYLKSL
jgi:glycosyltransferase involved in cell wall biosynthesis